MEYFKHALKCNEQFDFKFNNWDIWKHISKHNNYQIMNAMIINNDKNFAFESLSIIDDDYYVEILTDCAKQAISNNEQNINIKETQNFQVSRFLWPGCGRRVPVTL